MDKRGRLPVAKPRNTYTSYPACKQAKTVGHKERISGPASRPQLFYVCSATAQGALSWS